MRIGRFFGRVFPAFALVAGAGLAGCDGVNVQFGDNDGVPLSELDMSGEAPTEIVLGSPDEVIVTSGEALAIEVDGSFDARDRMRFALEDGTLGIYRASGTGMDQATINVTMPPPETIVVAGSGSLTADALAAEADLVNAGSGTLTISGIANRETSISVAGSGSVNGSGTTDTLDLSVAGSGRANLEELRAGNADVTIAGSGDAAFASDGEVEASILGSGSVRVRGSANCTSDSVGSGRLICEEAATETAD